MNTMEMKKLYWDLLESVNGGFIYRNEAGQHENIDDKSGGIDNLKIVHPADLIRIQICRII